MLRHYSRGLLYLCPWCCSMNRVGWLVSGYLLKLAVLSVLLINYAAAQTESANLTESLPLRIVVNPQFADQDAASDYSFLLLQKALESTTATDGPVIVERFPATMTQSRIIHELKQGRQLHVGVLSSKYRDDLDLRYVKVPLRKGLLGVRVLLAKQDRISEVATITEAADLQNYTTAFVSDWSELSLVRKYFGYVEKVETSEELYQYLASGRVDVLNRSIMEVFDELERYSSAGAVQVVSDVILSYPLADLYYVRADQNSLAERIQRGLNNLNASGEYEALFEHFHRDIISRLAIQQRRIIQLSHPDLVSFDEIESHWWYSFVNN